MLLSEHSAILLTCIKQQTVLKNNFDVLVEWPLKTGFTGGKKILVPRMHINLPHFIQKLHLGGKRGRAHYAHYACTYHTFHFMGY